MTSAQLSINSGDGAGEWLPATAKGSTAERRPGDLRRVRRDDCWFAGPFENRRKTGMESLASPPAALSVHLAIGSAYAWSVFKIPLEKSLHISGTASALPFTIGIVMLGLSAAVLGTRVDYYGPRWAMFVATVCFCTGLLIAGFGVSIREYWLVVFGYGVIGGIGLGIGYISPVSTLIKWFPTARAWRPAWRSWASAAER